LVFFSAAVNKLVGYLLPLLPATCALMGVAFARMPRRERWLIAPIALLGALPPAASVLTGSAAHGLRATPIPWAPLAMGLAAAAGLGLVMVFGLRSRAFVSAILLAAAGFMWVEIDVFPALDQAASARTLWSSSHPDCAPVLARSLLYGLYYYSGKQLPDCAIVDKNPPPVGGDGQTHQ
jgi:hypothetical protein